MTIAQLNKMPLGTPAPDFELMNVINDKNVSLQDLKSDKATVIMFICNHCPYVKHILPQLLKVARAYIPNGISFIAISSNNYQSYPTDSPQMMKKYAAELNFPFPYLTDETQEVAKAYKAECTPEFYIFDQDLKCVYQGRFDGATPGNTVEVTGEDLTAALDQILADLPISPDQKPSIGCSIKWNT